MSVISVPTMLISRRPVKLWTVRVSLLMYTA